MRHLVSIALALGMSLTAAAQGYRPVSLGKVNPVDVFPYYGRVIGNSSSAIRNFNQYMDPVLREVVYTDHAINMMYKYGTTKYSADQYKIHILFGNGEKAVDYPYCQSKAVQPLH